MSDAFVYSNSPYLTRRSPDANISTHVWKRIRKIWYQRSDATVGYEFLNKDACRSARATAGYYGFHGNANEPRQRPKDGGASYEIEEATAYRFESLL